MKRNLRLELSRRGAAITPIRGWPLKRYPTHGSVVMYSGRLGIRLDLLAQVLDEDAKIVHLVAVVGPPDRLQQFAVRDRLLACCVR